MDALLEDYHYNQRQFVIYIIDCHQLDCHNRDMNRLIDVANRHQSPLHILVNEEPAFVTRDSLMIDTYFSNIIN